MLRALRFAAVEGLRPADILDVKEPRTARKLLAKAGLLDAFSTGQLPDLDAFLDRQGLIRTLLPLTALRRIASSPRQ
jgi:hypothetical protein